MAVIEMVDVTHRYGRTVALWDVSLRVEAGSVYALIGPNGAGKTTLMQVLLGLRRPTSGSVNVLGKPASALGARDRAEIGYVAEGQRLPGWMTVESLEAFVAPLHTDWDAGLAAELRRRFGLRGASRVRSLSRGERMKVALLCSLPARPRLLLLDEPFAGLDVVVKDELVRGILATSVRESTTVLVCSHDLGELEMLADHVGFLHDGRLRLSDSLESVRERWERVEIVIDDVSPDPPEGWPLTWLGVERSGRRISFVTCDGAEATDLLIARVVSNVSRVERRSVTLRELFFTLAGSPDPAGQPMEFVA